MHIPRAAMILSLSLAAAAAAAPLRPPQPQGAALERALDRLLVVGNVLYVAAHPDDENTRLLAWAANGPLLRAGYLSITRGDGGQNLIGSELGAPLGLIRTQELLAARGLDGAEQLFTRARDFGYSKSPEETLAIWGHDAVLADVVLAIRRFRPDVIVTRFPPQEADTHGHHTASARLALEAFARAADPAYLPDEVHRALGPWQARRVVWNAWNGPGANLEELKSLPQVDVGGYDPWLGLSYGELAGDSRSMHKSQGFGAARRRGPAPESFKLLAGQPMQQGPLDGLVLDWSRVPGTAALVERLQAARAAYRAATPEAAIPALLAARKELVRLPENPWKQPKLEELDRALVACAGLFAEAAAEKAAVSPGGALPATLTVLLRRPAQVMLASARAGAEALVAAPVALEAGKPFEVKRPWAVPVGTAPSNPYWLELPRSEGLYPVRDPALAGLPEEPAPLAAELVFRFGDQEVPVRRALVHKWTDPVLGERYRRVEVLPAVTVDPGEPLLLFPDHAPRPLAVTVKSVPGAKGELALQAPAGFRVEPARAPFDLPAGGEASLAFTVFPPEAPGSGALRAVATSGGRTYDRSLRRVEHAHVPIQTWLPPAEVRLVHVDVAHARHRVGYVPGPGDEVPEALRQAGYQVTLLSPAALLQPLDAYEAIVVGVRAYNTEPALQQAHAHLMAWVEAGGTLVLQYLTNNWISAAPPKLGPYPFTVGRGRVTDETAPVEASAHPALSGPNRIGPADWEGWVQERGLYFAQEWDERYAAPLALHDPGEKPLRGALLVAHHGKGTFVYTGLAFFRQLPAGVPGAFRLFANLLDLGAAGAAAKPAPAKARATGGPPPAAPAHGGPGYIDPAAEAGAGGR